MPIIKIYDFDRDTVIQKAFKTVKVKGVRITVVTPENEHINIYGKIIEVKEVGK